MSNPAYISFSSISIFKVSSSLMLSTASEISSVSKPLSSMEVQLFNKKNYEKSKRIMNKKIKIYLIFKKKKNCYLN